MCCHTFRATGLTNFLANGGTLENAQVMADHASPRTTQLYDRTGDEVTLDEVDSSWRKGVSLPAGKPIVLSFDNGYQSQYTQALPVLRRLGWVGNENIQLTGLPPSQGGLGDEQIRGLLAAGWELDTQGISHADLIALDAQGLHEQVAGARTILRRRYGVPVNWFCYPSGHYDATVLAAVRAAGYRGSTTVVPGWARPADDPYRLPRLRVLGGTAPQALLTLIAGIRNDPPAPPIKSTVHSAGSQFSRIRSTDCLRSAGICFSIGLSVSSSS